MNVSSFYTLCIHLFCSSLFFFIADLNSVRLVDGINAREGRVEIMNDGEWGTVCDDNFNTVNAQVVCRELGLTSAYAEVVGFRFGAGVGSIWLDNVDCDGSEDRLAACSSRGWGINDCSHNEDVGVICHECKYCIT